MAVTTKSAMKLSLYAPPAGRVAQLRKMGRALEDTAEYQKEFARKKEEFKKEKESGLHPDKKDFDEQMDPQKKPLVDVLEGTLPAFLYVPAAAELTEALRLSTVYTKINTTLVLGRECHKAAQALASLKKPFCLDPDLEFYETDPETEEEALVCTAASFHKVGLVFSISVDEGAESPRRFPWWQMATAIRHGMPREKALEAMTIVPSKILGLEQQFGSIEVGKIANLQILTGDPLKATTWVDQVVLDGQVCYERSKDRRLQYVGGVTPSGQPDKKTTESK
jgi:imidazolonepropionase-like amidohydrolase